MKSIKLEFAEAEVNYLTEILIFCSLSSAFTSVDVSISWSSNLSASSKNASKNETRKELDTIILTMNIIIVIALVPKLTA